MTARFARAALGAYIAVCAIWLLRLDYGRKISTNVLDLVPADQGAPELAAIRDLADNVQGRVVLFVLRDETQPGRPPLAAAQWLAGRLAARPAFETAEVLNGDADEEKLGRAVYGDRANLLLPGWLAEQERDFAQTGLPSSHYASWVARRAAARLEEFLATPEAMAVQGLLPSDPLLRLAPLLQRAQALGAVRRPAPGAALVWSQIAASPLSEAGQGPVQSAVDAALAGLAAQFPQVSVQWTGVGRFAAASRARIEREIKLLNSASLLAVLAVACLFVRRLWKLAHLVPVVLCSLLGAWTVSTLVYARVHILVFVIGSLLSGVAIDYGFYLFMQPYVSPAETYAGKVRRLIKPLLASCLTTVAGFSLLLASDLPLIRQVGLFVSAGLVAALGAALLYFAQWRRPYLEPRAMFAEAEASSPLAPSAVEKPLQPRRQRRDAASTRANFARAAAWCAAAAALAIAALAPWHLRWNDDVRELDVPLPAVSANDDAVRRAFGDTGGTVYLTYGGNLAEARSHLAGFLDALARAAPDSEPFSLGLVLPTAEDYAAMPRRLRALRDFPTAFAAALSEQGFRAESFAPFFTEWNLAARARRRPTYDAVCARLERSLSGPLRLLASDPGAGGRAWLVTLTQGPAISPPAGLRTVEASELRRLNRLFAQYRWSALHLSLVGLGLVIASVFALYPARRALRIALIPAGSCFFVFGVLGLIGQTLNLFHLLGAFLGVCLAHNYSIFSSDSAAAGRPPPAPVRLSGLCAAASFGVLAASHIPIVQALGQSVCLIVLAALAALEIEARLRASPA